LPGALPPPTPLKLPPELKQRINKALSEFHTMMIVYNDLADQPIMTLRGSTLAFSDTQLAMWIRNPEGGFIKSIARRLIVRVTRSRIEAGDVDEVLPVVATRVPPCASCHALNGAGLASEFPRLAGQHSRYIADQLRAFRSDSRLGTNSMMHEVSAKLSESEINAVADYISGLHR